jgi:replicative DNA helicase
MKPESITQLHSLEAEQSVLGGILLINESYDQITPILKTDDFYNPENRKIFKVIEERLNNNQVCDVVTLSEHFSDKTERKDMLSYLGSLVNNTPSATNITAYANIVREKSQLRETYLACQEGASLVLKQECESDEIVQKVEQKLFDIANASKDKQTNFKNVSNVLRERYKKLTERQENGGNFNGISTGLEGLDAITNGFHNSELTILAGRPAQGKSALAMNMAIHAGVKSKLHVAIFSLEMPSDTLGDRILSSLSGVPFNTLRNELLDEYKLDRITAAMTIFDDAGLYIDDGAGLTPSQLRSKARQLKRSQGLDIIFIDYLQQMTVPGKRDKVQEMTEVSRQLKVLAMELDIPVIALASLNRSPENRENKRPLMADLRESGSIESDADNVMFIYRDEVYDEFTSEKGIAEIILRKQRNGPLATAKAHFQGEIYKFCDYSQEDEIPMDKEAAMAVMNNISSLYAQ